MKKQFLICPECEKKNQKKIVLAEIGKMGVVVIRRSDTGLVKHHTLIQGKLFSIICGNCGTVVYIRDRK